MCAYPEFKLVHGEMKKARPGLNYFTAVSEIRTMYEGRPEWQGYLEWVRAKHPHQESVAKDPSPRKTIAGQVSQPVMTAPGLPAGVVLPQALPQALPFVPQAVPQALPQTVPVVPQAVLQIPTPPVPQIPTPPVLTVPTIPSVDAL